MMNKPFTRNELINILRGWHKSFGQFGKSHERNVQALNAAADLLEQGKWISVKERLPRDGETVLVFDQIEQISTMTYCIDGMYGKSWEDDYEQAINLDWITHWMPLPEVPKED